MKLMPRTTPVRSPRGGELGPVTHAPRTELEHHEDDRLATTGHRARRHACGWLPHAAACPHDLQGQADACRTPDADPRSVRILHDPPAPHEAPRRPLGLRHPTSASSTLRHPYGSHVASMTPWPPTERSCTAARALRRQHPSHQRKDAPGTPSPDIADALGGCALHGDQCAYAGRPVPERPLAGERDGRHHRRGQPRPRPQARKRGRVQATPPTSSRPTASSGDLDALRAPR